MDPPGGRQTNVRHLHVGGGGGGTSLAGGGGGPHIPVVEPSERIAKLETSVDWIKIIGAILVTVMLAGFTLLTTLTLTTASRLDARMDALNAKVDAIPARLSEEFRAMRAEMAAQTSAIANSITATKQVQPQILVLPAPTPTPSQPSSSP